MKKQYLFLLHSQQRLKERGISQFDVIKVLSGEKGYGCKGSKKKDSFERPSISDLAQDWKYCIEGNDMDGKGLRIIVTFSEDLMAIIAVIRI